MERETDQEERDRKDKERAEENRARQERQGVVQAKKKTNNKAKQNSTTEAEATATE